MLDSIQMPFQAVAWPLLGAAIVLSLGRFLPNWLHRWLTLAAAAGSAAVLWTLRTALLLDPGSVGAVARIAWNPLNLFRMNPALHADNVALAFGFCLSIYTGIIGFGVRGVHPREKRWHGLMLLALAGSLVLTMAANLLTMALGSALVDLALVAYVVSAAGSLERMPWRVIVPGILSTLALLASALQMDAQIGTASLHFPELPALVAIIMGVAGFLRSMVFPLFPGRLNRPEQAAMLVLPFGLGLLILGRVQSLSSALMDQGWMLVIASVAMLSGGLLTWSAGTQIAQRCGRWLQRRTSPDMHGRAAVDTDAPPGGARDERVVERQLAEARIKRSQASEAIPRLAGGSGLAGLWAGAAIHQTAYALLFPLMLGRAVLWPLVGLAVSLGIAAIWWGIESQHLSAMPGGSTKTSLPTHLQRWLEPRLRRAAAALSSQVPYLGRLRQSDLRTRIGILAPALALASLAGVPLSVGAVGRWHLYALMLGAGSGLLAGLIVADTLLAAGIWCVLVAIPHQLREKRVAWGPLLAMLGLVTLSVSLGIAPGMLTEPFALDDMPSTDVSLWALGSLYIMPWLVGAWLAHVSDRLPSLLAALSRIVGLDWLYRAGAGLLARLGNAVHWLGEVGEGEGWWGWALVVLGLSVMFLLGR